MSAFTHIPCIPPDQIFGIVHEFQIDPRKEKTNLCIGVYRSEDGLPVVFQAVKDVEKNFHKYEANKDYLAIRGETAFCNLTAQLIFGAGRLEEVHDRCYVNQTVGGSGALTAGAEFVAQYLKKPVYVSAPTWVNHVPIFEKAGCAIHTYPYFDKDTKALDFSEMRTGIESIPDGSAVLFHASCHNPTGCDPTPDQWKVLAEICKKKALFPFFDMAYQGFGEGLEEDAVSVRTFLDAGLEFFIAYSYSKNMGLYGERTGALVVVANDPSFIEPVGSVIRKLIRTNYSNCPRHGSTLVSTILSNKELEASWKKELTEVRSRVQSLRLELQKALEHELPEHDWSFFTRQNGMFSMCGFPLDVVRTLKSEYAIYMTESSRINIAGLSKKNIAYFIDSLKKVYR